jgi:hypothetical protein
MIREQTMEHKVALAVIRGLEEAAGREGPIPDIDKATDQEWTELESFGSYIINALYESKIVLRLKKNE